MSTQFLWWIGFGFLVLTLLTLDLVIFHRKAHVIKIKEAFLWTGFWVFLALLFNAFLYVFQGSEVALQFLTGYLIEKSLSIDNLFVFVVIFSYFQVPLIYQHRVLYLGILGALLMRGIMIVLGLTLMAKFHWIVYVFGSILLITAVRLGFQKEINKHPQDSLIIKFFSRHMGLARQEEGRFLIRHHGRWQVTRLFFVLLIIELTDLIFAIDSIPAIFAVTQDPFIIYSSNVFAMLGLRSLYFALAGGMQFFHYLKWGLAIILGFVGAKMLISDYFPIPTFVSLLVIISILGFSVWASVLFPLNPQNRDQK